MSRITFRSIYAQYRKNPNIRMLVNLWYDGNPTELLQWESRHMLKRLVLRAISEIASDPDAAKHRFLEYFEEVINADVNQPNSRFFISRST